MEQGKFRKLNIELPVQPTIDQRPWLLAGLLLAVLFLGVTVYALLRHKGWL